MDGPGWTIRVGNFDMGRFDTHEQAEKWAQLNLNHRLTYAIAPLSASRPWRPLNGR